MFKQDKVILKIREGLTIAQAFKAVGIANGHHIKNGYYFELKEERSRYLRSQKLARQAAAVEVWVSADRKITYRHVAAICGCSVQFAWRSIKKYLDTERGRGRTIQSAV